VPRVTYGGCSMLNKVIYDPHHTHIGLVRPGSAPAGTRPPTHIHTHLARGHTYICIDHELGQQLANEAKQLQAQARAQGCCCSRHRSFNCDAAAGIIFFAARARKTHQQWKWVDLHKTITQIQGGNYNSTHPQVRSWCCSGIACGRCSGPGPEGWLWPSSMPCQLYSLEQLMPAPH
jgi:hypothetical protein